MEAKTHRKPFLLLLAAICAAALSANSLADIQGVAINDYKATPPFLDLTASGDGFPSFLLAVSRDNQMFFKAYSDYGDIDGDNIPETTYRQDIEYYGLFNPDLCYEYDVDAVDGTGSIKNGGFIPKAFSARDSSGNYTHVCSGYWSGNFMNWASATRLDIVQKVIYGGKRLVDTATETFLIGAWTPPDNHSFVKHVQGSAVISGATPITDSAGNAPDELTLCRTSMHITDTSSNHTSVTGNDPPPILRIAVGDFRQWDFQGRPCFAGGSEAVRGFDQNFMVDAAGEIALDADGNRTTVTGTARPTGFDEYSPSRSSPLLTDIVNTGTLKPSASAINVLRTWSLFRQYAFSLPVKVCDTNFINAANKENCRPYGTSQKPAGMLQRYGEPGLMKIGMIATSYRAALHGGILRAAVDDISMHGKQTVDSGGNVTVNPEINQVTGIFNLERNAYDMGSLRTGSQSRSTPSTAAFQRSLGQGRIVAYLDDTYLAWRRGLGVVGGSSLTENDWAAEGLSYESISSNSTCGFTGRRIDESCMSWGNPYAEMIYEAVNYLAGGDITLAYVRTGGVNWGRLNEMTWGTYRQLGAAGREDVMYWNDNEDLLAGDLECSPLNILAINSSVISHDADDIPANAAIGGSTTNWGMGVIEEATNDIGDDEGLHGQNFILPAVNTGFELNVCDYRELVKLEDVRGLCPNAPAMQGSYLIAGAAYYAHTTDLRTDLDGDQTINFLGIEMRPNVPQVTIPLSAAANAATVLLQPGYARRVLGAGNRNRLIGGTQVNHHNGRLTQFQAIYPPRWTIPNCRYEGVYLVGWEDGLSGTDFDVDFLGYLDFKVHVSGSSCPFNGNSTMVEVGTQMSSASQGTNQSFFGFTIAGTGQDGFHAYSGNYGQEAAARTHIQGGALTANAMSWPDPGDTDPYNATDVNPVPSCGITVDQWDPSSATPHSSPAVTVDLVRPAGTDSGNVVSGCAWNSPRVSHLFVPSSGGTPSLLRSPLYYAAKYGGFKDSNDNDKPDLESEWDALNNRTGLAGADGEPDNYFLVTDPTVLDSALERALIQGGINQRTASGTAAALVANEREGLGAVFQALFEPSYTDDADRTATWFGTLHALFIDSRGLLREDDGDGELEGYDVDKVVTLKFNQAEGETEARVFNSSDASNFMPSGHTVKAIPALGTIWNGRKWLDDADFDEQRTYDTDTGTAADRRYITTWIDANEDGIIAATNEVVSFHANTFNTQARINHLDVATSNEMEDIVRFVRGDTDRDAYHRAADDVRNREIEYDAQETGTENMRLGDIVNSSPAAVTSPSEAYDLLAGNSGYGEFREKWDDRRQMVYVGANDGMLHAFNAGFYNAGSRTVSTSGNNSEDAHALGKEMWAHIPRSLLPQLKWLIDKNYASDNHAYYMDGSPRVFDARVYSSSTTDTDHPGGWATILVAGMRLGGGTSTRHIIIDTENDGIGGANTDSDRTDDVRAQSSYLVADITNPEEAPVILAELSPVGLGYTTSRPAVVPVGGKWYLVFGTGPNTLATATRSTTSQAELLFYDLENLAARTTKYNANPDIRLALAGTGGRHLPPNPTIGGHFVGGITVSDTDLDGNAEALYVTTVGGDDDVTGLNTRGAVIRVVMNESANYNNWTSHVLLNANQPMVSEPTLAVDEDGHRWVYAGSGRLFVADDNSNSRQQTLYGFLDFPLSDTTSSVSISGLVDVNDVRVYTDGSVDSNNDGTANTNFEDFRATVLAAKGWKRDYTAPGGSSPSQRTVNPSTLLGEVLFNTAYTPPPPSDASTAAGCGVSSLGESVLIGIDFLSGVTHPFGVLGTTGCTLQVCTTDGVREALGEQVLGQGLSSLPSLHLGSPGQHLPGQVTVVVQKSTGEVSAVQADTVDAGGSTNIDWREYIQ